MRQGLRIERPTSRGRIVFSVAQYATRLFAKILHERANTASAMPEADEQHRDALRDAAEALHRFLVSNPVRRGSKSERAESDHKKEVDISDMSPDDVVRLLHIME
jgi:hypothetical protein